MAHDRDVVTFQDLFLDNGFNADSDASFRLQSQDSQAGSIHTAGFIYDLVVTVERCDRLRHVETCVEWFLTMVRTAEDWKYFLRDDALPTLEDFWVSFCRTLAIERIGKAKFGPQHAATCRHFYRGLFCGDHEVSRDDLVSFLDTMFEKAVFLERCATKFFITRNGHLGLASRDVNVGDYAAILATGTVPFIVRKVGEQEDHRSSYILVSGSYVDGETFTLLRSRDFVTDLESIGVMYGEAARERARDVYEARRRCDPDFAFLETGASQIDQLEYGSW
jgi:hypothetical protein